MNITIQCSCGKKTDYVLQPVSPVSPSEHREVQDGLPTANEQDALRERLRVYTEITLPAAGLTTSKTIGGPPQKVRVYAQLRYQVKNIYKLSVSQWEDLLTHFDNTDPVALVAEIEKACS